jgi:hypothetical protein
MLWPLINSHMKSEGLFDQLASIKRMYKLENKIAFYDLLLNVISTALATAERKGINILSPDKGSPDSSMLKDELNRLKGLN